MNKKRRKDDNQSCLIEIPEQPPKLIRVISPSNPVWTENKAQFIMRYLRYFVYITKHGTYIDGFAGPQQECDTDAWAAKLVIESEPKRLRHFHLCDLDADQIVRLEALKISQTLLDPHARSVSRHISIYPGDFNKRVDDILNSGTISEKEATFCLLDQRTFQCDWATVEKLARYKKTGMKIELFYFLANKWFDRTMTAHTDTEKLDRWWGRSDWAELRKMSPIKRSEAVADRFRTELGYKYAMPWQIFKRRSGGQIMYFMVHATDHPEAPVQMSRAYRNTVMPLEPIEQLELWAQPKAPDSDPGAPPAAQQTA